MKSYVIYDVLHMDACHIYLVGDDSKMLMQPTGAVKISTFFGEEERKT